MPELRDLYPVGDDEDVAALALYRQLHCGHCNPPSKRTSIQERGRSKCKTGAAPGGSASFQGEALRSCSCNKAVIQPKRGAIIHLRPERGGWSRKPPLSENSRPHLDHIVRWSALDDLPQPIGPSLHSRSLLRVSCVAVIYLGGASLRMVEQLRYN